MKQTLTVGLEHLGEITVTPEMTAARYVPGTPEAFATPRLVGLIEGTAMELMRPHLDEDETSVGTSIALRHLAPTPVGMRVRCLVRLAEVDRRRLVFQVEAWDEADKIAEATHERFVVRGTDFARKLATRGGK